MEKNSCKRFHGQEVKNEVSEEQLQKMALDFMVANAVEKLTFSISGTLLKTCYQMKGKS